jgi:hypothetical protein
MLAMAALRTARAGRELERLGVLGSLATLLYLREKRSISR